MKIARHNPSTLYPKYLGYAHAVEISGASRMLFVSGLNGYEADGKTIPEAFEDQCEMIWAHLRSILASAGMGIENLVSLRTYLANPEYRVADAKIRKKHLGDHEVALTVVSATLLHPSWKLEVEAVASA
jgi:2-iminobutanoate/2-iminopropanoate deaminase